MVLFTKEVFLQLKQLTSLHINVQVVATDQMPPNPREIWQIYIQGLTAGTGSHSDIFSTYIGCFSKEEAHRMYKDLAQQVVESGEVPDLNTKLIDAALKE